MYSFKNNNKYRETLPTGVYDLVIVSLIHQSPEMVFYMVKNLKKYVKGKFLWVAHYNNKISIDENSLPEWAWLVRDTVYTEYSTRLLTFGITKAIDFAITNLTSFKNLMTLSSGSSFFREFQVPEIPIVCIESHEKQFNPNICLYHTDPISITHAKACSKYLNSLGHNSWQYVGCDADIEFYDLINKRNFKWFKGCQWSGQVFPYEVAKMLSEDVGTLYDSKANVKYAAEEIYFSTYAYNYAIQNNIEIKLTEVIIDWNNSYCIEKTEKIDYLRNKYIKTGHAVCKLSDDVNNNPVRNYLLS